MRVSHGCKLLTYLLLSLHAAISLGQQNTPYTADTKLFKPLVNEEIDALPLIKSRWQLRSIEGRPLFPGTIITLEFRKYEIGYYLYGQFKNNKSCGGNFLLYPENRFKLLDYCQELDQPADGTPDHDYIIALYNVTSYKIEGNGNVLSFFNKQDEIILQYRRLTESKTKPADIYGNTWQLISLPKIEAVDLSRFTLHFDDKKQIEQHDPELYDLKFKKYEHAFSGTTACQNYKGSYFAIANMLAISALDRTFKFSESLSEKDMIALDKDFSGNWPISLQHIFDLFCSKQEILAKDHYLDLLKNVWRYEVTEDQLELYSSQDKMLIFRKIKK